MNSRFWLVVAGGLFVRVALAALPGYADDRALFRVWGTVLADRGPLAIYAPAMDPAVDYSPGYLYVLWAAGLVAKALGNGAAVWRVVLEIAPIAGDLIVIALLYRIAQRFTTQRNALVLAALAAFAPPLWIDSSLFGQSDSLPIALALVAVVTAIDLRFARAWPALALAVIVKPLVIMLGPTLAVVQLRSQSARSASFWRSIALALAIAYAIAYFLTLPFTTERSPIAVLKFLLDRYTLGAGKAPFTTQGAFSVYPLITNFHTSDATRLGPLSFQAWGTILVLVAIAASAITLWRSYARERSDGARLLDVLGSATLSLLALFLFATRMHERYLLPAIVFGAPLTLEDRPTAFAVGWLVVAFTVNCTYTLHHFIGGGTHPITVTLGRAVCAFNVVAFAVLWQRQIKRLSAA